MRTKTTPQRGESIFLVGVITGQPWAQLARGLCECGWPGQQLRSSTATRSHESDLEGLVGAAAHCYSVAGGHRLHVQGVVGCARPPRLGGEEETVYLGSLLCHECCQRACSREPGVEVLILPDVPEWSALSHVARRAMGDRQRALGVGLCRSIAR